MRPSARLRLLVAALLGTIVLVGLVASPWNREPEHALALAEAASPSVASPAPTDGGEPDAGTQLPPYCRGEEGGPWNELPDPLSAWVRERLRSLRGPPHRKRIQRRGRIAAFLIRLPEWDEEGAEWLRLAPDRREEGVDLYARALAYRAWFHFKDEQGLALSEKAVEADPQDALVQVVRAMVLEQHERRRESLAALRRAFELQPLDPHLGLGLARRLRRSARPDEALAALQVYRDSPDLAPERAEAAARFALALQDEPRLAVGYAEVERDGVTVRYPAAGVPASAVEAALETILDALAASAKLTGTPRRHELLAVLYLSREAMRAGACVPGWAYGSFSNDALHLVYEPRKGAVRAGALRHEATHAHLATVVAKLPTWLDEGIAQEVEFGGQLSPDRQAWLRVIVKHRTWIPLATLSQNLHPYESSDASLAYSQSHAMVRFLLDRQGPDAIARAARFLAGGGNPERVLDAVFGRPVQEAELVDYLVERLGAAPLDATAPR